MATRSLGTLTIDLITKSNGFVDGMNKADRAMDRTSRSMQKALQEQERAAEQVASTVKRVIGVVAAGYGLREIGAVADAWGQVNSRLRLATDSAAQHESVQRELMRVANLTYSSYEQLAGGFASATSSLSQLGVTMRDQLRVQEALLSASIVSGANDQDRARAMDAFNKALATGVLRGDEFNTIQQTSGRLVSALAQSLGKTDLQLIAMARSGGIAMDKVLKSLIENAETFSAEVESMPVSFADAGVKMRNSFMGVVGRFDDATGASAKLTAALGVVADNMGYVIALTGTLATVAIPAAIKAMSALTASMAAAFAAFSPVVLAATAGIGAIVTIVAFSDRIRITADETVTLADAFQVLWSDVAEYGSAAIREMESAWQRLTGSIPKATEAGTEESKRGLLDYAAWVAGIVDAIVGALVGVPIAVYGAAASGILAIKNVFSGDEGKETGRSVGQAISDGMKVGFDLKFFENAIDSIERRSRQLALNRLAEEGEAERWGPSPAGATSNIRATAPPKGPAGRSSADPLAQLRARLAETKEITAALEKYGLAVDSLLPSERELLKIQGQIALAQKDRVGRLSDTALAAQAAAAKEVAAQERVNREMRQTLEMRKKYTDTILDANEELFKSIQNLNDQAATWALTDEETARNMERLTQARIEERLATEGQILARQILEQEGDKEIAHTREVIDALERQLKLRKEQSTVNEKIRRQSADRAAYESTVSGWVDTVKSIDDVFRRGFADMVNGGEGTWNAFTKSLATTFKTTVADALYKTFAQPFVVQVVAQMAGLLGGSGVQNGVLSAFGMGMGSGGKGGVSVFDGLSLASNIKTAYSLFTGGVVSTLAGGIAKVGTVLGSTALKSFAAGMKGATLAPGLAGPVTTGAGGAMGMGAKAAKMLPVVGWIIAGMALSDKLFGQGYDLSKMELNGTEKLLSSGTRVFDKLLRGIGLSDRWANIFSGSSPFAYLFTKLGSEKRYGGGYQIVDNEARYTGGPSGGDSLDFGDAITQTWNTIRAAAASLGGTTEGMQFLAGYELSPKNGNSYVFSDFTNDGSPVDYRRGLVDLKGVKDEATIAEAFQLQLERSLLQGLKFAKLDEAYARVLRSVDINFLDSAGVQDLLGQLGAVQAFFETIKSLPFKDFKGISVNEATYLADRSGGNDALLKNIQAFYDVTYTEQEKFAHAQAQITEQFKAIGYALPESAQQLRSWAEALSISSEEGLTSRARLYELAEAYGEFSAANEAQLSSLAQAREALVGLEDSFWNLVAPADEFTRQQAALAKQFEALGYYIPETTDEFWAMVSAAGALGSEVGSVYRGLLGLTPAFADYLSNVDAQAAAARSAADAIAQAAAAAAETLAGLETGFWDLVAPGAAFQRQQEAMRKQFAALGYTLPKTTDEFWAITSAAGQLGSDVGSVYRELLGLTPAFADYLAALKEQKNGLNEARQAAMQSVSDQLGGVRENILLDQLGTDENRYAYFKSQADQLAALLPELTGIDAITSTIDRISSLTSSAYGSLDAEQKLAEGGEFLRYLNRVEEQAAQQLQKAQTEQSERAARVQEEAINRAADRMVSQFTAAIGTAAKDFGVAGEAMESAARQFAYAGLERDQYSEVTG